MGVNGQLQVPGAPPRGKSPRCPMDRRLGGPQSRSERSSEETWTSVMESLIWL